MTVFGGHEATYVDRVAAERARRVLHARQSITIAGVDAEVKMAVWSGLIHSVEMGHSEYSVRMAIFEQEATF